MLRRAPDNDSGAALGCPRDTISVILPESAQHCFLIDVLSGLPILAFQVGLLSRFVCCLAGKFCCDAAFKRCRRLWTGFCEVFRPQGTPLASRWGRYQGPERGLLEANNLGDRPKILQEALKALGVVYRGRFLVFFRCLEG